MMKKKIPFWATVFTLAGICILCGLGGWQIQRLQWKTRLISEMNAAYVDENPPVLEPDFVPAAGMDFLRGRISGEMDYEKEIRLGPRYHENRPGFHVLTPLRMKGGYYVLVDRGWVPEGWSEDQSGQGDMRQITGILRRPVYNVFLPQNIPAEDKWYNPDVAEIAAAKDLPHVWPHILIAENDKNAVFEYPLAEGARPEIPNNHLQYAIFWFTLAAALALVSWLRFYRRA